MREPRLAQERGQRPSGVIDTLSAGYGIVNQQIWIILIPILLDLFLWLGPQVSVSPLVGQALTQWDVLPGLTSEQVGSLEQVRQSALDAADQWSILSLLSPPLVWVPSLAVLIGGRGPFQLVDNVGAGLALGLTALVLGLILGCTYYALLAQQVRDGAISPLRVPGCIWRAWRRLIGLALALAVLGMLLGLPLLFMVAGAALVSPVLASFGIAFLAMALVWMQLYLFFATDAIFVSQVGPLLAIRRSVMLMRGHLWPALLLIMLTGVIVLGLSQIWVFLATSLPGAVVGILANAYVASGLVAASMVFYQERIGKREDQAKGNQVARA